MPRQARVRRGADIRQALRQGRRLRAGAVDLFVSDSPAARPRVGVVVPAHGHSLVERNRVKRRLREIARRELLPRARAAGARDDLVLRARPSAYGTPYRRLRADLLDVYSPAASPCSPA